MEYQLNWERKIFMANTGKKENVLSTSVVDLKLDEGNKNVKYLYKLSCNSSMPESSEQKLLERMQNSPASTVSNILEENGIQIIKSEQIADESFDPKNSTIGSDIICTRLDAAHLDSSNLSAVFNINLLREIDIYRYTTENILSKDGQFELMFSYSIEEDGKSISNNSKHTDILVENGNIKCFIDLLPNRNNTINPNDINSNTLFSQLRAFEDNDIVYSSMIPDSDKIRDIKMDELPIASDMFKAMFGSEHDIYSAFNEVKDECYNLDMILFMISCLHMYANCNNIVDCEFQENEHHVIDLSKIRFIRSSDYNRENSRLKRVVDIQRINNDVHIMQGNFNISTVIGFAFLCLSNVIPCALTLNNKYHVSSTFGFTEVMHRGNIIIVTEEIELANITKSNIRKSNFTDSGFVEDILSYMTNTLNCNPGYNRVNQFLSFDNLTIESFDDTKNQVGFPKLTIPKYMGMFINKNTVEKIVNYKNIDINNYEIAKYSKQKGLLNTIYDYTNSILLESTKAINKLTINERTNRYQAYCKIVEDISSETLTNIVSNALGSVNINSMYNTYSIVIKSLFLKMSPYSQLLKGNEPVIGYDYSFFGNLSITRWLPTSIGNYFNRPETIGIERLNGRIISKDLKAKVFLEWSMKNWAYGSNTAISSKPKKIYTNYKNFRIDIDSQYLNNYLTELDTTKYQVKFQLVTHVLKMQYKEKLFDVSSLEEKSVIRHIDTEIENVGEYEVTASELLYEELKIKDDIRIYKNNNNEIKLINKPKMNNSMNIANSGMEKKKIKITENIVTYSTIKKKAASYYANEHGKGNIVKAYCGKSLYKTGTHSCVIDTIVHIVNKDSGEENKETFFTYIDKIVADGIDIKKEPSIPVNFGRCTKILEREQTPIVSVIIGRQHKEIRLYKNIFCKYFITSDYNRCHTFESKHTHKALNVIFFDMWIRVLDIRLPSCYKSENIINISLMVNSIFIHRLFIDTNMLRVFACEFIRKKSKEAYITVDEYKKEWTKYNENYYGDL